MSDYLTPGLHALFIWWFSTGIVFWLNRRAPASFPAVMAGASVLAAGAFVALVSSVGDASVNGAYVGFTAALMIWVWVELGFYLGYVTGIRKESCDASCGGWRRFGHAIQACLWHEIAVIACFAVIAVVSWDRPNQVGLWTFAVLKWMHHSARLNVFLGVRNIRTDLLPRHLDFLKGFFRHRAMNALFPFSIGISVGAAAWIYRLASAPDVGEFTRTGLSFVGALMILAIIEHVVLMLPFPIEALWAWWLTPRSGEAEGASLNWPARRARAAHVHRHGIAAHPALPAHQERRRP